MVDGVSTGGWDCGSCCCWYAISTDWLDAACKGVEDAFAAAADDVVVAAAVVFGHCEVVPTVGAAADGVILGPAEGKASLFV